MNTKNITDRAQRKEAKRKARKEAPALEPRPENVARGSLKKKVKQMPRGQSMRKR
jgi:hypothetical protein